MLTPEELHQARVMSGREQGEDNPAWGGGDDEAQDDEAHDNWGWGGAGAGGAPAYS